MMRKQYGNDSWKSDIEKVAKLKVRGSRPISC